jgi:hypothetical protein
MIRKLKTLLLLCFAMFLAAAAPAQGRNTINTFAGGGPDGAQLCRPLFQGLEGLRWTPRGTFSWYLRYRSLRTFKDFSAAASAICSS